VRGYLRVVSFSLPLFEVSGSHAACPASSSGFTPIMTETTSRMAVLLA
jgi:hypothetical protein